MALPHDAPIASHLCVCVCVFQAQLPAQTEVVTTEDLMAHLGKSHHASVCVFLRFCSADRSHDTCHMTAAVSPVCVGCPGECVLSVTPREKTDGMELNFQQVNTHTHSPAKCTGVIM